MGVDPFLWLHIDSLTRPLIDTVGIPLVGVIDTAIEPTFELSLPLCGEIYDNMFTLRHPWEVNLGARVGLRFVLAYCHFLLVVWMASFSFVHCGSCTMYYCAGLLADRLQFIEQKHHQGNQCWSNSGWEYGIKYLFCIMYWILYLSTNIKVVSISWLITDLKLSRSI